MLIEEIIGAFTGQNRRDRTRNTVLGLGAGLFVGAVTALLLAPQSGAKTRRDLKEGAVRGAEAVKNTAQDVADKTKAKAEDIGASVSDTYHYFREKATDVSDEAAKEARRQARKARVAARHAKEGAGDVKEDIEDTAEQVKEDLT